VNWVDGLGFLASTAVLATFCMRRMIMLRLLALASNILFAAYGYIDHLLPVLVLHLVLFPVNILRLLELAPRKTFGTRLSSLSTLTRQKGASRVGSR
jgi:hypothetical protein